MKIASVVEGRDIDLIRFLDSLPEDEVYTVTELSAKHGRDFSNGGGRRILLRLPSSNKLKISRGLTPMWVYGNQEAIRNLRTKLGRPNED